MMFENKEYKPFPDREDKVNPFIEFIKTFIGKKCEIILPDKRIVTGTVKAMNFNTLSFVIEIIDGYLVIADYYSIKIYKE